MIIHFRRLIVGTAIAVALAGPSRAEKPHMLLLGAAKADGSIIAVGERGTILRSGDEGHSWETIHSPTLTTLTSVHFASDGKRGWAVGHDMIILATTDGGYSWKISHQGENLEDSLLDVCVSDNGTIIAVGAYGLSLRSIDAGESWQPLTVQDDDSHLNRITRGLSGTLYIAGERGTLLRSHDGGEVWESIASPYDGSFYGVLPLKDKVLLAYGLRGHIFRSEDDGENWASVPINSFPLLAAACVLGNGEIVLTGQARAFLISYDTGHSFVPWAQGLTTGVAYMLTRADGNILAFGENGVAALKKPGE